MSIENNFLVQVLDKSTRGDLVLTNVAETIKDIKTGGSLCCSDHTLAEFMISRDVGLAKSGVRTLNFGRANFKLFNRLLAKIPWDAVLKDKDVEESWLLFKDALLKAQEVSIPLNKKVGRRDRKPAWLGKDLLGTLRAKKGAYKLWKQGRVTWEEYRDAVQTCRCRIRKAKVQVEQNLVRDMKNSKKTFYRYIGQKRQAKTGVPSLVNLKGELASTDEEKAEVLNEFFASVFTGGQDSSLSHVPEPCTLNPICEDQGVNPGRPGELQAGESHLCAWEDHGTDPPG